MRKLYQKQDMEQHKIQDRIQIHRNTHTHTHFSANLVFGKRFMYGRVNIGFGCCTLCVINIIIRHSFTEYN